MPSSSVSIVIPCYNGGVYLEAAVESAIRQEGRFRLDRILIVDDHSDDPGTLAIMAALDRQAKVAVIPNHLSRGPAGARNSGIAAVQSEWLAFLDADDMLTPGSIHARLEAITANPGIVWCGGDFVNFVEGSEKGPPVYRSGLKPSPAFDGYQFDEPLRLEKPVAFFLKRMLTWMGAVIIRTEVLQKMGGFREELIQSEDNNLFIRLAREHDFLFVPEIVLAKREHDAGLSKNKSLPREWTIRNFQMLLRDPDFSPYYPLIRRRLKYCYRVNYEHSLKQNRYLAGFKDWVCYAFYKARMR